MAWPTVTIITTQMDAAGDDPSQARAQIKQTADNVNLIKDSLDTANGPIKADGSNLLPAAKLPTVPANKGGTGQTTYTIGDILYASASGTLTKLSAGTAGFVLTSNGAGAAPSWQAAGGGFVTGTRMSFNQSSAPTGWTKDTTAALNDSIMRIVTGTVANGGSTAFSTFNGQTSVGATTLAESQMPAHSHELRNASNSSGSTIALASTAKVSNAQVLSNFGGITTNYVLNSGGGGSHNHSITTNIKYNDFIIASKN